VRCHHARMQGVPLGFEHAADRAEFRPMSHRAGLELFRARADAGWSYRMLYLDVSALAQISGGADAWNFKSAVVDDPVRAQRVNLLLQQLWQGGEALAQDEALAQRVHTLRPLAHTGRAARPERPVRFGGVIEHMQQHLDRRLRLDDLARVAGLG
jgi:hypothetical protein